MQATVFRTSPTCRPSLAIACAALTFSVAGAAAAAKRPPSRLVITPTRGFRGATGTYSINPRPGHARGSRTSADIRFVTEPEGQEIHYYYKGGSEFPNGVVKSIRARRTLVVVSAPASHCRFRVFVPTRPGHITTVRLRLPPAPPPK